jgi:diaminopimelate epimerase
MKFQFSKYQGTGNDFVIIDNRAGIFPQENIDLIKQICTPKTGVGADGLMLVEQADGFDFRMVYFNSDGRQSTMCGNGGRCIAAFAVAEGIAPRQGAFIAVDGPHEYSFTEGDEVVLKMTDVSDIEFQDADLIMNTGSPHFVRFVEDVKACDMVSIGKSVRYHERFLKEGINVNIVDLLSGQAHMRTYERGVEDETYSCGTGTVAAALSIALQQEIQDGIIPIQTKGGLLKVHFKRRGKTFYDICLQGPAKVVFTGTLDTTCFE